MLTACIRQFIRDWSQGEGEDLPLRILIIFYFMDVFGEYEEERRDTANQLMTLYLSSITEDV